MQLPLFTHNQQSSGFWECSSHSIKLHKTQPPQFLHFAQVIRLKLCRAEGGEPQWQDDCHSHPTMRATSITTLPWIYRLNPTCLNPHRCCSPEGSAFVAWLTQHLLFARLLFFHPCASTCRGPCRPLMCHPRLPHRERELTNLVLIIVLSC